MIVGTGCCALPDSVALTKAALQIGAAGVIVLPPFYFKNVSDDGLFAAYAEIIQQIGDEKLKLYLYHFPATSGIPITIPLIERLLVAYPNTVMGIKDSTGDLENMRTMATQFPGFRIFAAPINYFSRSSRSVEPARFQPRRTSCPRRQVGFSPRGRAAIPMQRKNIRNASR